MIVEKLNFTEGAKYPEYSLSDNTLTIDGKIFNLDAEQEDSEKTVVIISNSKYIARIIIPPAEYEERIVSEEQIERIKKALNIEKVKLILWPEGR
jgi:hypothetical protein